MSFLTYANGARVVRLNIKNGDILCTRPRSEVSSDDKSGDP